MSFSFRLSVCSYVKFAFCLWSQNLIVRNLIGISLTSWKLPTWNEILLAFVLLSWISPEGNTALTRRRAWQTKGGDWNII